MLLRTRCVSIVLIGFLHLTVAAKLRCFKTCRNDYIEVATDEAPSLMNDTGCYNSSCINLVYSFGFRGQVNGTATNTSIDSMLYLKNNSTDNCYNVFLMNWMKEANNNAFGNLTEAEYVAVTLRVPAVALEYGKALQNMSTFGFDLNNTHVVAHSLGAQMVALLGTYLKNIGKPLYWITGLDPARPLYEGIIHKPALDKSCASNVQCIHTDPGGLGMNTSCGDIDFFANYFNFLTGTKQQRVQPGCLVGNFETLSPEDRCSHDRAWMLMAESAMKNCSLIGIKAPNYQTFAAGNGTSLSCLGYGVDLSARGYHFLNTNASPPYGKGLDGINT